MKKAFIAFGLFLLLALAVQLNAQIPRTLSYQGILTDIAGKPRPDADYQFTFCLYDTSTGGVPIWNEQKTLSVNKGGLFSTILGDQKPFGAEVKFDKQYWLGIQVENEAELSPRIPLTSVGYSMNAVKADTAKVAMISGAWMESGSNIYRVDGNVGIGTTNPTARLQITEENSAWGQPKFLIENTSDYDQVAFGIRGKSYDWEIAGTRDGNFVLANHLRKGPALVLWPGPSGCVQVVGESSMWGHPRFLIENTQGYDQVALGIRSVGAYDWEFAGMRDGRLILQDQRSGSPNLIINPGPSGAVTVPVLQITGGSDLAEPFAISHPDSLPLGSLVVIDPDQPGKLKQATEPYDKRVAGVISGAGGINPGLTLTQEGKLTGSQHVALTGKVYALATAANGAIEPGDLLTTSSLPGHAMKATDHERAFGSVIGKAMSSLNDGEGLVLVLVNLH